MFSTDDTIVAIATPLGRGALALFACSGLHAASIARPIESAAPSRSNRASPRLRTLGG